MRLFEVIVTLKNGLKFQGVLNARSKGHACAIVRQETGRTDIWTVAATSL